MSKVLHYIRIGMSHDHSVPENDELMVEDTDTLMMDEQDAGED